MDHAFLQVNRMSDRISGNLLAFVAMVLWATQFPAMAHVMQDWQPILMAPLRLSASAIFLLFLLLVTGGAHHIRNTRWRDVFSLGGLVLTGSTVLFIWGQKYAHPVTAAIVISMMPVISAIFDFFQRRDQITVPVAAGIMLAVVGGYVTALAPGQGLFGFGLQGGELLLLAAITLFVWYTRETTTRLAGISELAQAAFTLTLATIGASVVAVIAVLMGYAEPQFDFRLEFIAIIAWVGAIAVGFSMSLWFAATRRLGTTITTMHHNLVPFYVMLIAVMGGGQIFETQAWGALLVCAGAILAQVPVMGWMRRTRAPTPAV